MTSLSGYVNYLAFTAGSNKGNVQQGDVFNSPFGLPQTNNADGNYTSSKVVKSGTLAATTTEFTLDWSPVVPGTVVIKSGDQTIADIDGDGKLWVITGITETERTDAKGNITRVVTGTPESEAGTVTYGTTADGRALSRTVDGVAVPRYDVANLPNAGIKADASGTIKGLVTLTTGITGEYSLSYVYNNAYIPQNDVPLLNAEMKGISLVAEPHRIAVYYKDLKAVA